MFTQESLSSQLLDQLSDGVYCIDHSRKILYWNKGAENLSGYSREEVLGKSCWDQILLHQGSQDSHYEFGCCPLIQTMKDGQYRQEDIFLSHKNGQRLPIVAKISPLQNDEGKVIGVIEAFSDNTSKYTLLQRMKEIEDMAMHDPLTRLANRRYLEETINSKLEELRRNNWPFGVLFIDIDQFKQINDNYGHDVGDEVLKHIANTLNSNNRPFDINGRWGGEEFVSLVSNVNIENLYRVAERYRKKLHSTPLELNGTVFRPTVSIGATVAHADDCIETLIKRADNLMYQSKSQGRNCVSIDTHQLNSQIAQASN